MGDQIKFKERTKLKMKIWEVLRQANIENSPVNLQYNKYTEYHDSFSRANALACRRGSTDNRTGDIKQETIR